MEWEGAALKKTLAMGQMRGRKESTWRRIEYTYQFPCGNISQVDK